MIVDGTNLIVGRVGTVVAKKAMLGEQIIIVNCENMIVTGKRQSLIEQFLHERQRGVPVKGPFISRLPDRFVRRMIRGMLPYKKARGTAAYKRIMCYIGVPDKYKDQKMETIEGANISKMKNLNYITVGSLVKSLGGNYE